MVFFFYKFSLCFLVNCQKELNGEFDNFTIFHDPLTFFFLQYLLYGFDSDVLYKYSFNRLRDPLELQQVTRHFATYIIGRKDDVTQPSTLIKHRSLQWLTLNTVTIAANYRIPVEY